MMRYGRTRITCARLLVFILICGIARTMKIQRSYNNLLSHAFFSGTHSADYCFSAISSLFFYFFYFRNRGSLYA